MSSRLLMPDPRLQARGGAQEAGFPKGTRPLAFPAQQPPAGVVQRLRTPARHAGDTGSSPVTRFHSFRLVRLLAEDAALSMRKDGFDSRTRYSKPSWRRWSARPSEEREDSVRFRGTALLYLQHSQHMRPWPRGEAPERHSGERGFDSRRPLFAVPDAVHFGVVAQRESARFASERSRVQSPAAPLIVSFVYQAEDAALSMRKDGFESRTRHHSLGS